MIVSFVVLAAGALLMVGALVEHSWSRHVRRVELRRLAQARRSIGEQWRAVQAEKAERRREVVPWDR